MWRRQKQSERALLADSEASKSPEQLLLDAQKEEAYRVEQERLSLKFSWERTQIVHLGWEEMVSIAYTPKGEELTHMRELLTRALNAEPEEKKENKNSPWGYNGLDLRDPFTDQRLLDFEDYYNATERERRSYYRTDPESSFYALRNNQLYTRRSVTGCTSDQGLEKWLIEIMIRDGLGPELERAGYGEKEEEVKKRFWQR